MLGHDAFAHDPVNSAGNDSYGMISATGAFVVTTKPAVCGIGLTAAATSVVLTGHPSTGAIAIIAITAAFNETTYGAPLVYSGILIEPPGVDVTGTSNNILERVKQLIPGRWFSWVAPNRDAILGALSDSAAWSYKLIKYARAQTRLSTAYGIWLDIFSYDYLGRHLPRNGMADDVFRARIRSTILQERVTRAGMKAALTQFTGRAPWIFEPWNTYDTGGYSNGKIPGATYGSMGYGVGQGGYGNMNLPCQTFMLVHKGVGAGVPGIGGYGTSTEGYGDGAGEYVGPQSEESGITTQMVYDLIDSTKPTGTTCWTQVVV